VASSLPRALLDAIIRALDEEHELRMRLSRRAQRRREHLLRTVREALDAWRNKTLTTERAIDEIEKAIRGKPPRDT
jgi:hypothetical protein